MKIGILTFHCAYNYGAVLQAYALQEYLLQLGNKAYIINYKPKYLLNAKRKSAYSVRVKMFIKKLLTYKSYSEQKKKFHGFCCEFLNINNLDLNNPLNSYDLFIVGSDQIWNATITEGEFDKIYFGDFKAATGKKIIAYAASIGGYCIKPEDEIFLRKELENFHGISVRENRLKIQLQSILHRSIDCVLDPSLLVDSSVFASLVFKPLINQPYICIYEVTPDSRTVQIAERLVEQGENIQIIRIGNYLKGNHELIGINNAGPIDFLNYIKYAECVITTSFHGTAFSIVFQRPFLTVNVGKSSDSRIKDMLSDLDLLNCYVESLDSVCFPKIDYKRVEALLDKRKQESRLFLSRNLQQKDEVSGGINGNIDGYGKSFNNCTSL